MSNIEEIGHLVAPFEVDNNWVCTLCNEGKIYADSTVRHSCGNHLFHCSCLTMHLITNPLCPTCLNLGDGTIAQMNNVKVAVYPTRSNFKEICIKCRGTIDRREQHIKNLNCKHRFHRGCILDLLLDRGMSATGKIYCPLCL